MGGSKWHADMQSMLRTHGLCGERIELHEDFVFGSDRVDKSLCAWNYPVGLHGRTGIVNVAEIEPNCPGLLSDQTMGQLDISINTGPKTYHIGVFDVWDCPNPMAASGHAMVHADEFGDVTHLDPKFFLENSEVAIRKGTARRLRKAVNMVAETLGQDKKADKAES